MEEANVFDLITEDIPRSKFEEVVGFFKAQEKEFSDYIDGTLEDFYEQAETCKVVGADTVEVKRVDD